VRHLADGCKLLHPWPRRHRSGRDYGRQTLGGKRQRRRLFSYGDPLLVRYLHDGVIFGFRTFVSGTVVEPLPLVFLNWPERVEAHSVRQSRRLDTFIPCHLKLQGTGHDASIIDISAGGC